MDTLNNTQSRLDALNNLLGDVYGEEASVETLLEYAGFSNAELEQIKSVHLEAYLQAVMDLLESYPDPRIRVQSVLRHYGLLDGEPQAFHTIGDKVGTGPERIRQLVTMGLWEYYDPERQARLHADLAAIGRRLLGDPNPERDPF